MGPPHGQAISVKKEEEGRRTENRGRTGVPEIFVSYSSRRRESACRPGKGQEVPSHDTLSPLQSVKRGQREPKINETRRSEKKEEDDF